MPQSVKLMDVFTSMERWYDEQKGNDMLGCGAVHRFGFDGDGVDDA